MNKNSDRNPSLVEPAASIPAAGSHVPFAELERRNQAALVELSWRAHLKKCRACRLAEMGGIHGNCQRGRQINYAREHIRSRA